MIDDETHGEFVDKLIFILEIQSYVFFFFFHFEFDW